MNNSKLNSCLKCTGWNMNTMKCILFDMKTNEDFKCQYFESIDDKKREHINEEKTKQD